MGSMKAHELAFEWFPAFRKQLLEDAYATPNGMFLPCRKDASGRREFLVSRRPELNEFLPRSQRKTKYVYTLSACFADLDIYNVGLNYDQGVAELFRMKAEGLIPAPSIIASSGRGMYVYWMLRHRDDPFYPPRANGKLMGLWGRVQRAIDQRLSHLGSDSQVAGNAAGVLRIPGSVNTKSNTPVRWTVSGEGDLPWLYTLDELAPEFGLKVPAKQSRGQAALEAVPVNKANKRRGSRGAWFKAYRQFEALRDFRGGFDEGCRGRALYVFSLIAMRLRRSLASVELLPTDHEVMHTIAAWSDADFRREQRELLDTFDPPFDDDEARAALSGCDPAFIDTKKKLSGLTIANWLHITPDEAEHLTQFATKKNPKTWTKAKEFLTKEERAVIALPKYPKETPAHRKRRRQNLVRAFLVSLGPTDKFPTLELLIEHLQPHGLAVTKRIVAKDLEAIGIQNPRSRKARDARNLPFCTGATPSKP